jgi:hypothetical protein
MLNAKVPPLTMLLLQRSPDLLDEPLTPVTQCSATPNIFTQHEDTSNVCKLAFEEMREHTKDLGVDRTQWVRIVHCGYGNAAWRDALRQSCGTIVFGSNLPEGAYVHVPENSTPDKLVHQLMEINLAVRQQTKFLGMKRANKSRVVFKEVVVVDQDEESDTEMMAALPTHSQSPSPQNTPSPRYLAKLTVGEATFYLRRLQSEQKSFA